MKVINKYLHFLFNRLGVFLLILLFSNLFGINYVGIISLITLTLVLKSVLFFVLYEDFLIENNCIVLLSTKNKTINFETIESVIFIENSWFIGGSQKIKILFFDGTEKTIRCDGVSPDDDYPDSFYKTYEYMKTIFKSTYFIDNGKQI